MNGKPGLPWTLALLLIGVGVLSFLLWGGRGAMRAGAPSAMEPPPMHVAPAPSRPPAAATPPHATAARFATDRLPELAATPADAPPQPTSPPPGFPEALLRPIGDEAHPDDWSAQPIAANLAEWRRRAEQDPRAAQRLANTLRRCTDDQASYAQIAREWAQEAAEVRANAAAVRSHFDGPGANLVMRYRYRVQSLEHCLGVVDPKAEYLRWLERAARELDAPDEQARLRLRWIEEAFIDMPEAGQRIGRIDEALRRRDQARAWLEQLRDAGDLVAINDFVAYRMRGSALYAADPVEASAWYFVWHAANAAQWPGRRGQPSAVELWRTDIEPDPAVGLGPAEAAEASERGRALYRHIFGSEPV